MLKNNLEKTLNVLRDLDERFALESLDHSEIVDIAENVNSLVELNKEIEETLKNIRSTDKKHELLELFIRLHKQLSRVHFYVEQVASMVKLVMWKLYLNKKYES